MKFLVEEEVKPAEIHCRLNYSMGKRACHMKVFVIGTVIFLGSVNKSQTYHILIFSNSCMRCEHSPRQRADFGKQEFQCIILHPTVVHEFEVIIQLSTNTFCSRSLWLVCSKDVEVTPEGPECCCVCRTSASLKLEENIFLEQTVICDKTWVHSFFAESMQSSME
jgi:hypothetical protein